MSKSNFELPSNWKELAGILTEAPVLEAKPTKYEVYRSSEKGKSEEKEARSKLFYPDGIPISVTTKVRLELQAELDKVAVKHGLTARAPFVQFETDLGGVLMTLTTRFVSARE